MKSSKAKTSSKVKLASAGRSKNAGNGVLIQKLPGYFLLFCLLAAMSFIVYLLWPFLTAIFLAGVLAIVFMPMHKWISRAFGRWNRMAAFLSCLIVVLVLILPMTAFVYLVTEEAIDTYDTVQTQVTSGVFDEYILWGQDTMDWAEQAILDLEEKIGPYVDLEEVRVGGGILDFGKRGVTSLAKQVAQVIEGLLSFVFQLLVMLFALFYFFKDGDLIVKKFGELSPLPEHHEKELFDKIVVMVKAIVFGVFFAAILQGVIGGVGFTIAGISNSFFWGTAMGFFSIVPLVGTAIIWVPAVIILLFMGNYYAAIFIFLWGMLVVGSSDNILRTYFIGTKARTYPLLTFFVIIGGILVMGVKGVIVGPLVLMILMSLLHIYEIEYKKVLKK